MKFDNSLKEGYVKKTNVDKLRANSLIEASKDTINTTKLILLNNKTARSIFRELYEGLRQYCEALGYLYGYKFLSHESITYFISDILKEENTANYFDRARKLRNGINYYGRNISLESVKDALIEVPKKIKQLKKYEDTKR